MTIKNRSNLRNVSHVANSRILFSWWKRRISYINYIIIINACGRPNLNLIEFYDVRERVMLNALTPFLVTDDKNIHNIALIFKNTILSKIALLISQLNDLVLKFFVDSKYRSYRNKNLKKYTVLTLFSYTQYIYIRKIFKFQQYYPVSFFKKWFYKCLNYPL